MPWSATDSKSSFESECPCCRLNQRFSRKGAGRLAGDWAGAIGDSHPSASFTAGRGDGGWGELGGQSGGR